MLTRRTAEGLGKPVISTEWASIGGAWQPVRHSTDVETIADQIVASGARDRVLRLAS